MSTLTKLQVARRARQYLTERDEAAVGFSVPMLYSLVDDALDDLGREIGADPARRHLLRTDPASVTISVVAGVADLATLLTTNKVILEYLRTADIFGANGRAYSFIETRDQLRLKRKTDNLFTFFTVEGRKLYTRDQGTLDGLTEDPTVAASYIPTITTAPDSENTRLVALVALRAMKSLPSQQQKIAAAAVGKNAT